MLKARLPLPSANIGRRGGLRLVYRVEERTETVWFVMLYGKQEKPDVRKDEIERAINAVKPFFDAELIARGLDPKKIKL